MKKKIFIAFVIVVALSLTSISSVFAATVYKPKQFKVTGTGNYINEATWSASETGGGSGKLRVENYFSGYTDRNDMTQKNSLQLAVDFCLRLIII